MGGHVESVFEFCIGDTVIASRRKVTPLNEEGGVWQESPNPLDHRQEYHLDSSVLTRRRLSQDDQRRPKRTQIAAKFGKRHQSFDKNSLFSPSPSRSPEADTIAALDTRLESEIEGTPMTSLPYSDKCDRERSIE